MDLTLRSFPIVLVIDDKIDAWVEKWGPYITHSVNSVRNYVVNQVLDALAKYCRDHADGREAMPTIDEIHSVVKRQVKPPKDDASEEDKAKFDRYMEVFQLYWDCLLPCVAIASVYWRPNIRHHQTISKATFHGEECVPPGSEER